VIQGISEAAQTVSFPRCRAAATAREIILKDPAVESLSSFIASTERIRR